MEESVQEQRLRSEMARFMVRKGRIKGVRVPIPAIEAIAALEALAAI